MGQFQSKEYDGDPYVDLMRALPERELIWWVQKAIWLVEGWTFLDHFSRTYPSLFIHKCRHCNGAGAVTCPHCAGYKLRQPVGAAGLRLSGGGGVQALIQSSSRAGDAVAECQHCGGYCDWDNESEWEEKWVSWESKLAYYDRTYGQLMNEWYEDVLHEGNLDEDTPHEDAPPPGPDEAGPVAEYDRRKQKFPELLSALMKRYGGHPYEAGDMLPFNTVDPVKRTPLENLWALGHNRNELPPELHPYNFPELLISPLSPLTELDHQIRMEALICQNLDAALRDERKPNQFAPTAGTVPCPACSGTPYTASFFPNVLGMFKAEPPMWQHVLSRMSRYTTQPAALADAAPRHFLEYPQQDAESGVLQRELAAKLEGPPGPEQNRGGRSRAIKKGARASLVGGADRSDDPTFLDDWGARGLAVDDPDGTSQAQTASASLSGTHRPPPGAELAARGSGWISSSSAAAGPALAASLLRDVRRLKAAQGSAAEAEVTAQLQERYSPDAVAAMLALGSSSRRQVAQQQQQRGGSRAQQAAVIAELPCDSTGAAAALASGGARQR